MTNEFFEALRMLEKEKGIPMEYLVEKIRNAILIAVKRDAGGLEDSNVVNIDPDAGTFYVARKDVENPAAELTLEKAREYKPDAVDGDIIEIPLETRDFGRIAAQAAKHVIRQGIREAERDQLLAEYQSRQNDIVTATVLRTDPKRGGVTLEIGRSEAVLPKSEQVPGEVLRDGERIKVYVVDVVSGEKGPRIMISRTHPGLVKRLFEMQVPEIYDGVVEIKAISREAGSRTKLAVYSRDENVDAVGACIGPKGSRVSGIVEELGGEKIDVVKYSGPLPLRRGGRGDRRCGKPCLPRHCAGPSAVAGHRQQGPERPPGRQADRMENRYPPRERFLWGRIKPDAGQRRRSCHAGKEGSRAHVRRMQRA